MSGFGGAFLERERLTAIVLAGGKGTRLQSVVSDVPKPMAPIKGRPFLEYLLKYLSTGGITSVVLSTGYKSEMISGYFGSNFYDMAVLYSIETTPLGTGGAIKLALEKCSDDNVFVLNGDTFFNVDLPRLLSHHLRQSADISMSLKEMRNFDRYGVVELNENRVTAMREKGYAIQGYINGGVYCVQMDVFSRIALPEKFSFEEFLVNRLESLNISGLPSDGNFIDIGIPEDYEMAQELIPEWVIL
jgi:D-glycero-alpha-D-manno-heptose 1-phosphate guanylyltransferase